MCLVCKSSGASGMRICLLKNPIWFVPIVQKPNFLSCPLNVVSFNRLQPHEPLFLYWLTRALSEHLVHHHLGVILTPDMIRYGPNHSGSSTSRLRSRLLRHFSTWYEEWALLQTEENTIIFMTLMNTLESISFDISAVEESPHSDSNEFVEASSQMQLQNTQIDPFSPPSVNCKSCDESNRRKSSNAKL